MNTHHVAVNQEVLNALEVLGTVTTRRLAGATGRTMACVEGAVSRLQGVGLVKVGHGPRGGGPLKVSLVQVQEVA